MAYYNSQQAAFRLGQSNSAFISQLLVAGRGRELTTSIALAMTACSEASLPAGIVESPVDYFMQNEGVNAGEVVGVINELVPVDYRTAIDLAKKMFLIRYELATCPFKAFGHDLKDGVNAIFGLTTHLPTDVIQAMECSGGEIISKYRHFKDIFAELKKD